MSADDATERQTCGAPDCTNDRGFNIKYCDDCRSERLQSPPSEF